MHFSRTAAGNLERADARGEMLGDGDFGKRAHVLRSRAPPKPGNAVDRDHHREGDHQHDDAEHRDGAEVAGLVEIEDQHRDHLGFRGEQDDGGGQFADHADEDEAPGGDHAGAQQRRRDVAERLQPRRAEDAACLLEIGIHGAERRLQLLIGGRQRDGDEGDQQDPQRAVEHEGRARVAQEQPDAEHDARHRDRRGRQECERAPAGDRLARRDVGDHDGDHRADGRGQRTRG